MLAVTISAMQESPAAARFERVAGVSAAGAEGFFRLLRGHVGRSERDAACALVAYPLQHPDGAVANAAECEARYDTIFTVAVRRAIGKQLFDELFVNERGIMIGLGEVWIAGRCATPPCGQADLRIVSLNSAAASQPPPKGKVLLACRAVGQLLHVSADGAGGAALSLWRSGRLSDAPTLTLPTATDMLHDDLCGARTWTFADGSTSYTVSTLSCDAHLSPPPMGAVGELVVKRAGMDDVQVWCDQ